MLKLRNKRFCLVMTLVFALTMVFPFAAFASSTEVLSTPTVNDDSIVPLGTVFIQNTAGKIKDGDSFTISLPKDFKFMENDTTETDWSVHDATYSKLGGTKNNITIPANYLSDNNGFTGKSTFTVTKLDKNELKVTVNGDPDTSLDTYMFINLGGIYVDSGFDGDITLNISAPSGSGFSSERLVVGRVGSGDVDIVVTDDPTFSDNDTTTIRVDESVNDTLDNEAESLKFTLPNGFEWGAVSKVTVLWGEASVKVNNGATQTISGAQLENVLKAAFTADNKKLKLNLASIKYDINGDGTVDTLTEFSSTKAISFKFEAPITVSDETEAQVGDVVAQIDGDTSHNQNEIVVGHYGQFETSISAGEPTNIVSGQLAQKIADIKIKESIKGSLVPGRTLLLTLPSNYKWGKIDTDSDNSAGLTFEGFPGKDGKTAKWTFTGPSTDAAELTLSGMEVAVEPGTTGDLVIEAGGTAGLTGELTVAKVSQPVAIKASATPVLSIGKNGQAVGDLTVTENVAGAISDNNDLILQLPEGFKWSKYSDIKVTEGNLKIDDGGITTGNNDRDLIIPIDSDSSVASTIELKNLEVGVDRTAPEGDVTVKVKGAAVGEVNNESDVKDEYGTAVGGYLRVSDKDCFPVNSDYQLFPETATAAKTVLATVGTPAPGESKLTTTVTLGDNGSYISGGRIMVQLRDAANALGVAPQNIFWDNATKTATFIKGDRVAQITVGVSQVKLNGVALPTDKGAELKDGRTFVSLSQAGIALGAAASWDNTTKTATLTVK